MSTDPITTAVDFTYVYCLLDPTDEPTMAGAPAGVEGSRALRVIGLEDGPSLIAATVPGSTYDSEAIERRLQDLDWVSRAALAHEGVVEHFARRGTVIPMKLFTIYRSDDRAVAELEAVRPRIDRLLARLRGRTEWGVRILFDQERANQAARARGGNDPPSSGTAFLLRKKQEKDRSRQALELAQEEVTGLRSELEQLTAELRTREGVADVPSRALLDVACLVDDARTKELTAAVERIRGRLDGLGCSLALTGPWPAYNFLE